MMNGFEYRRHAEDCLRHAEQTGLSEAKSALMMTAGAWHRLAHNPENSERISVGAVGVERQGQNAGRPARASAVGDQIGDAVTPILSEISDWLRSGRRVAVVVRNSSGS